MKSVILAALCILLLSGCASTNAPLVDIVPLADAVILLAGAIIVATIIGTFGRFVLKVLGIWR